MLLHLLLTVCDKCVQRGVYVERRITYPDMDATLRTHESFIQQLYPDHHIGISPLTDLNIDMIETFTLDYLHVVLLGVTRKTKLLWMRGSLKFRIGSRVKTEHDHL